MKLLKILLSTMFVFSAIIRHTEVGMCRGYKYHSHQGIRADYDVLNSAGKTVAEGTVCESSWPSIQGAIRFDLKQRQIQADYNLIEIKEHRRLVQESKGLIGAEVTQEGE